MSRNLAALVALAALCGLVLQFLVSGATEGLADPLLRLWALGRFFTILTNALVFVSFALFASGRNPGDSWMAGVVLSIGMVGLVFHLLLAPEVPLTGLTFWADLWLHTLTPLIAVLWWLGWGGRALTLADVPRWLIWPAGYCLYALLRGQIDGIYPYFFLDVGRFGAARIALNILGLCLGFALAGLVLLGIARALARGGRLARP